MGGASHEDPTDGGARGGALINDGQGQVVIDDITPNSSLTEVLVTGHEDADGFAGNWTVNAIAICANPLPGMQRISGTAGFDSNSQKTAHSQCPGLQQLIGLGAEIRKRVGMSLGPTWPNSG